MARIIDSRVTGSQGLETQLTLSLYLCYSISPVPPGLPCFLFFGFRLVRKPRHKGEAWEQATIPYSPNGQPSGLGY